MTPEIKKQIETLVQEEARYFTSIKPELKPARRRAGGNFPGDEAPKESLPEGTLMISLPWRGSYKYNKEKLHHKVQELAGSQFVEYWGRPHDPLGARLYIWPEGVRPPQVTSQQDVTAKIASKLLAKGETELAKEVLALGDKKAPNNLGGWDFFLGYPLEQSNGGFLGSDADNLALMFKGNQFLVVETGPRNEDVGVIRWSHPQVTDEIQKEVEALVRQYYKETEGE
ncbi:MAG: hypothetical protein WC895_02920 [Candidatus Shapirobacteria bacterium]|jgi:hypothetical protein